MAEALEVNIDGLVGPTHNYAGLSLGNRASIDNAGATSNPREAALQGLAKMRHLHRLGVPQGVMPPQQRPDPNVLARLGLSPGSTITELARRRPELVPLVMSASSMWAANAATVTPSSDAADGRVHFTPANLSSTAHRSFEPEQTQRTLQAMFADDDRFVVHPALPGALPFADEGAANHGRFAPSHGDAGVHFFVFGRAGDEPSVVNGVPRRQTELAGQLISESHGHDPSAVIFARQSNTAIEAGAFHNDVVSVANQTVLFTHSAAFDEPAELYSVLDDRNIQVVEVGESTVPLTDAIRSYLFNSQLVTLPDGSMALIAPTEVMETPSTKEYLDAAVAHPNHPIGAVHSLDLRESMRNGGGPACLRLRVVMTADERAATSGRVLLDDARIDELEAWVRRHYREALSPADLVDPLLETEQHTALDELTQLLGLGSIYPFQT